MGESREFLLRWNEQFPLDRWWRKKYDVPFGSEKHRSVSYIDIYYDWLEDGLFDKYIEDSKVDLEKEADYKKTGKWLKRQANVQEQEKMTELFNNIDISSFNDHLDDEPEDEEDIPEE